MLPGYLLFLGVIIRQHHAQPNPDYPAAKQATQENDGCGHAGISRGRPSNYAKQQTYGKYDTADSINLLY